MRQTNNYLPMKLNRDIIIKTIFATSIFLGLIGLIMQTNNWKGADFVGILFLSFTLIFLIITIYEIFSSSHLSKTEKIMWTIGIIILSSIGGFIYLLSLRKDIVSPSKKL